jgi:hypothetical protein
MKRPIVLAGLVALVAGCGPGVADFRPPPSHDAVDTVARPSAVPAGAELPSGSPLPEPVPAATPTALPFRTVFQSLHFAKQADHPEVFVFRSDADVTAFAATHPGTAAALTLDFNQEMGVLVLFGVQSSWILGEIVGIDDPGPGLQVRTVRWVPDTPGEGLAALSDPAHYVAIPRSDKPVTLVPQADRRESERAGQRPAVQGPPAVRVGMPILLRAGNPDVRWHLESGSASFEPDRTLCTVTPTAPGPVAVTATVGDQATRFLLAGIAADVPTPLASIAGLPAYRYGVSAQPTLLYDIAGQPAFPSGIFIVTSAAEWQDLWSKAAAFGRVTGAVPRGPAPKLPEVDFTRQAVVVVTDVLYPPEDPPVLTCLAPSLEVVKPDAAKDVSHLDFDQSISVYVVPGLSKDTPVHATCSEGSYCPAPSPSGF